MVSPKPLWPHKEIDTVGLNFVALRRKALLTTVIVAAIV